MAAGRRRELAMDTVNWGTPPVGLFNFPVER